MSFRGASSISSLLLSMATLLAPPLASAGSEFDGRYSGTITCDAIPGQTSVALNTAFSITIADGKGEYQREVIRPDSRYPLGTTERGSTSVSPSGEVELKGGASGPTWRYEATYAGKIDNKTVRLAGDQVWHFQGKPIHKRQCTVSVRLSD